MLLLRHFREVVLVDTEFRSENGFNLVRCVCGLELRSGRQHRLWVEGKPRCPYPLDDRSLFVAFYSSAEIASHHSLGWPIPANILDLCIEFSALTSGLRGKNQPRSQIGAMRHFRLDSLAVDAKQELRSLAMMDKRNADYTPGERRNLLDYCWSDVMALKELLRKLEPYLCGTYQEI